MTAERPDARGAAVRRLRHAVADAEAGRRAPLSQDELDRFAHEIRPDADDARVELASEDGEPVIIVRAVVRTRKDVSEGEPASAAPNASPLARLSRREREVARLVAAGMTNQEIAAALGIRLGTVKDHVHTILERLGVRSRQQVVALVVGTATLRGPESR